MIPILLMKIRTGIQITSQHIQLAKHLNIFQLDVCSGQAAHVLLWRNDFHPHDGLLKSNVTEREVVWMHLKGPETYF